MKKILSSILATILLVSVLVGCNINADTDEPEIVFNDYYTQLEDFETVKPLLIDFYTEVQRAYNKSDKSDAETFELSNDFEDICDELDAINEEYRNVKSEEISSEEYGVFLDLIMPYLKTRLVVAEIKLAKNLEEKDYGDADCSESFNKLKQSIDDAYEKYSTAQ